VQGKKVFVEEQGGYSGVSAGLDENGFLLVRTGNETRRVISGGVRALA
jgi:BirA family biotin operon repressor/biotin-[acetyl-CoA-carboxylase] ligase